MITTTKTVFIDVRITFIVRVFGILINGTQILLAEAAAQLITTHPDYSILAGRVEVALLNRDAAQSFSDAMTTLNAAGAEPLNLIFDIRCETLMLGRLDPDFFAVVLRYSALFDSLIVYAYDDNLS